MQAPGGHLLLQSWHPEWNGKQRCSVCVCVCLCESEPCEHLCSTWLEEERGTEPVRKGGVGSERQRMRESNQGSWGKGRSYLTNMLIVFSKLFCYSLSQNVCKQHMIKLSGCRSGLMSALQHASAQWHPNTKFKETTLKHDISFYYYRLICLFA